MPHSALFDSLSGKRMAIGTTAGTLTSGSESIFRKVETRKKRKIANQLQTIHSDRIKADYYDTLREHPRTLAFKTIRDAKKVIEEIQTL